MKISLAKNKDKNRWDRFIDENNASFFHYFDWNTIFSQNKWKFIPLIAENEKNELIGVFPLYLIKKHFCSILKSLPEGASGGPILKQDLPEQQKNEILNHFLIYIKNNYKKNIHRIIINENITYDEKMNQVSSNVFKNHDFLDIPPNTKGHPSTFILKLKQPFEEEIWKKLWNGNLRNNIRKAKKNNVTILEDTSYQYEKEFMDMMHYHYQRFQTPLLKNEELKKRLHIFKNKTLLYVALHHNTPIAFLLCYYTPSTIYFSKLPHTYDARKYQTNALLCYHAIKQACEKGYQYIEFGITFNEYQARWKHKFKGKKIPLKQHQKQYAKIHCLCFDILDQLSWSIRNHKNIWNIKQAIIKKIIHLIK